MDPLSITASALTLIHAASVITTSLRRLSTSLRTVESRLSGLCDELASLTSFLEAVGRTLKGCKVHDLAHVEGDLWRQIELALADCQITLSELGVLVNKTKESSRAKGLGWRARAVVDLSSRSADIAAFRDRIHKSNWALQTMLHTITVSLSLRSNASQEVILFELDRLKSSIDEALRVSLRPAGGFSQCFELDSRVARNLRNLAEAAKQFHSAASSVASTIHGGSGQMPYSGTRASLVCEFPAYKQEWVEMCLEKTGRQFPVVTAPTGSELPEVLRPLSAAALPPLAMPTSTETTMDDDDDDDDEEIEFKRLFLDGLEDLARESIRVGGFWEAIGLLKEALRREEISGSGSSHWRYRIEVELSLCYILEDQWRLAEPIVVRLAKITAKADLVVCNMLHAISLDYLKSYDFESALKFCKKSLQAKERWLRRQETRWQRNLEYAETLGLLATIFSMQGDYISAEIYRRRLPLNFVYDHPPNPLEFIARHRHQLQKVLRDDMPDFYPYRNDAPCELETDMPEKCSMLLPNRFIQKSQITRRSHTGNGGGGISPLRNRWYEWERFESDTSKEVVLATPDTYPAGNVDIDKEPVRPSNQSSPLRHKLTRLFGSKERQNPGSDEDMDDEQSPSSSTSPLTRWFTARHIFGLKVPRTSLRKRPSDEGSQPSPSEDRRQRSFRLRRMEKVEHYDYFAPDDIKCGHPSMGSLGLADLGRMTRGENSWDQGPSEDLVQDHFDGQLQNGMCPKDMGRDPSVHQHSFLGNNNKALQPTIAELASDCIAELPCNPARSKRRKYKEPDRITGPLNTHSSLSPKLNTAPSSDGGVDMPLSAVPSRENRSSICEEVLAAMDEEPPSSSSSPHVHRAEAGEATNDLDDNDHLSNFNKVDGSIYSQPMPPGPDMNLGVLSDTLASLATILASIPNLKDDRARHFVGLKLGVILSRQKRLGNDDILGYDLQRIIKSLGDSDGDTTLHREESDPASEPTNHDDIVPLDSEAECSSLLENGIVDLKLSGERPTLKRTFSWVTKDEWAYAMPCRIEPQDDDSLSVWVI